MPITRAYASAAQPGNAFLAGKNKIINGDFNIWQRGTSLTFADNAYTADRFFTQVNTGTAGTGTISRQAFTPGTAPVAGYEGNYFFRYNLTATGTSTSHYLAQRIEDVTTFAGQTVTLSFWAKADSARTVTSEILQRFGSGGSGATTTAGAAHSVTTSWTRFSVTISVPSISGKTIGTGSSLEPRFYWSAASGTTIDIWGVQLEAGNVATAFQTATGTLAGELQAAQRYYVRYSGTANNYAYFGNGTVNSSTNAYITIPLPVEMRVLPTSIDTVTASSYRLQYGATSFNVTSLALGTVGDGTKIGCLSATVASGLTTNGFVQLLANNSSTAYVGFSAEL